MANSQTQETQEKQPFKIHFKHDEENSDLLSTIAKKLHILPNFGDPSVSSGEEAIESNHSEANLDQEDVDIERYEREGKFPESVGLPSNAIVCKPKRVLLIFNPVAGMELGKTVAERAKQLLTEAGVTVDVCCLEHKGHAREICENEDLSHYDCLCVVGGDGTFYEAINGLMKKPQDERIVVSMIPGGTGNAFTKEIQGGTDVDRAIKHVIRGIQVPMDVMNLKYKGGDIYSINSIHWGLASAITVRSEQMRWMKSKVRYTTAAFFEMIRGEKRRAKIICELKDGTKKEFDDEFCLLSANNIITLKKGMRLAPDAKINDGLIDVVIIRSSNAFDLLTVFTQSYKGTHTELDYVEYLQVKSFSVTPYKEVEGNTEEIEEIIDVDGDLEGHTPFTTTVLPLAIKVII